MGVLKDISAGWLNLIKKSLGTLEPEIRQRSLFRSEQCFNCESFETTLNLPVLNSPLGSKCRECGCIYPAYVLAPDKKCPLGKW